MNILGYFKSVHAQRQINKLARKYKNKKIIIYGAGEYFQILKNNFDLSKLNIVGIADKKFETSKDSNPTSYLALAPEELKDFDLDVGKMAGLIDSYDDIKQVLDWFKSREYDNSIIEVIPNNKIEINIDTEESKRTTILVNSQIYNEFNQFCNRHKEFDKKDLISMALKEYMQKYD